MQCNYIIPNIIWTDPKESEQPSEITLDYIKDNNIRYLIDTQTMWRGKRGFLKFYNFSTNKIEYEPITYNPYHLIPLKNDVVDVPKVKRIDPFTHEERWFQKITDDEGHASDFDHLSDKQAVLVNNNLLPSTYYQGKEKNRRFSSNQKFNFRLADTLNAIAFDIEVLTRTEEFPDAKTANFEVSSIGFYTLYEKFVIYNSPTELDCGNVRTKWCKTEKELLFYTAKVLEKYPIIVTFNGEEYDMPYLIRRAKLYNITMPFRFDDTERKVIHGLWYVAIDLYKIYSNNSLKAYMFGGKYQDNKMDSIAEALIKENKIEVDFMNTPFNEIVIYNEKDAVITFKLYQYCIDGIFMLSRFAVSSISSFINSSIQWWFTNLIDYACRVNNLVIYPSRAIYKNSNDDNDDEDDKYTGAVVLPPIMDVYYGGIVIDYQSMYSGIVDKQNISFETINCGHLECRNNKVPFLSHYTCTKYKGIISFVLGTMRNVRIDYWKHVDTPYANMVSGALKVFLNGSYGQFGNSHCPYYLEPMAESTTAWGRQMILDMAEKIDTFSSGLCKAIYGDTDSVFIYPTDNPLADRLMKYAEDTYGISMEKEKTFVYLVLGKDKKNYYGIDDTGKQHIRGMLSKKDKPDIVLEKTKEFLEFIKTKISNNEEISYVMVSSTIRDLCKQILHPISTTKYAFKTKINLSKTYKNEDKPPQHVQAFRQLPGNKQLQIHTGDRIRYAKVKPFNYKGNEYNAKPIEYATINELNTDVYGETFVGVLKVFMEVYQIDKNTVVSKSAYLGNYGTSDSNKYKKYQKCTPNEIVKRKYGKV